MNIMNDQPNVDYVTYFTQQLPKDLAAMAQLRDELAKRQGALTAVEDSNRLRTEAEKIRKDAKDESDAMMALAKDRVAEAEAQHKALNDRETALDAKEAAFNSDADKRSAQLDARLKDVQRKEKDIQDRETKLLAGQDALAADRAKLQSDREALDARIESFRAKAAALSV